MDVANLVPKDVNGELIREDLTEDQDGVALTVDIQFIDTSTCEPLADIYTDFWHCNATVSLALTSQHIDL